MRNLCLLHKLFTPFQIWAISVISLKIRDQNQNLFVFFFTSSLGSVFAFHFQTLSTKYIHNLLTKHQQPFATRPSVLDITSNPGTFNNEPIIFNHRCEAFIFETKILNLRCEGLIFEFQTKALISNNNPHLVRHQYSSTQNQVILMLPTPKTNPDSNQVVNYTDPSILKAFNDRQLNLKIHGFAHRLQITNRHLTIDHSRFVLRVHYRNHKIKFILSTKINH